MTDRLFAVVSEEGSKATLADHPITFEGVVDPESFKATLDGEGFDLEATVREGFFDASVEDGGGSG